MKMKFLVLFACLLMVWGTNQAQKAVKLWETPAVFEIPESVLFNDTVIYVSNVNGSPLDKNGLGYISRLSAYGEVWTKHWVKGLHAPKGMGMYQQWLYVTDIDRVAKIDCSTGKTMLFIPIEGSRFLNDIAVSDQGLVAVSDLMDKTIYLIENDSARVLLRHDLLERVNGLYWEGDQLYAGTAGTVYVIAMNNPEATLVPFIQETGAIDGLERLTDSTFIISDWAGKVQAISPFAPPVVLLNFKDEKYNAADIEMDRVSKTLFIPTFFGNSVAAYTIE